MTSPVSRRTTRWSRQRGSSASSRRAAMLSSTSPTQSKGLWPPVPVRRAKPANWSGSSRRGAPKMCSRSDGGRNGARMRKTKRHLSHSQHQVEGRWAGSSRKMRLQLVKAEWHAGEGAGDGELGGGAEDREDLGSAKLGDGIPHELFRPLALAELVVHLHPLPGQVRGGGRPLVRQDDGVEAVELGRQQGGGRDDRHQRDVAVDGSEAIELQDLGIDSARRDKPREPRYG